MQLNRFGALIFVAVALAVAGAHADLQNVSVGGKITILGEYSNNTYMRKTGLRWPASWLVGRPIGTEGNAIYSNFAWDNKPASYKQVSQWTRLHVSADFTDNVAAYVELDSVDCWGEDFRSNYLTGIDSRAVTSDDVEIYQAYIETSEMFGTPLKLRLGRQELVFGSEWLVGNNDFGPVPIYGLSFDAARLTYATEQFSVDAWWAKLAENSPLEEDGDVDFSGVYASYLGVEDFTFDAYWLWLRDGSALHDTPSTPFTDWVEGLAGVDDYDPTNIHTAGLRAKGKVNAFDFEAEAAYQWGSAGQLGYLFKPVLYGDDDAEYDGWTAHANAGYSFEFAWKPRVYGDYAYFSGDDNRDISAGGWLEAMFNPFYTGSSASFNRLFSDARYGCLIDLTDISNVHVFSAGISASPTEKLEVTFDTYYFLTDEPFSRPVVPVFGFVSEKNDRDFGLELALALNYQYSSDVYFAVGWNHLFVGKGLEQGQFVPENGLGFNGGSAGDDADYFWFETGISFGMPSEE